MPQPWPWQWLTRRVEKQRCKPVDLHHFCDEDRQAYISTSAAAAKTLRVSLTACSTSADHQALGGRLMRPKGMEDLAAFKVKGVKIAAAEERERDEYSSAKGQ